MIHGTPEGGRLEASPGPGADPDPLQAELPLAVLLLGGENDLGAALIGQFGAAYGENFGQILFVSVGVMDYTVLDSGVDSRVGFSGTEEAERLRSRTRARLEPYLGAVRRLGFKAEARVSIATSAVEEIDRLSDEIVERYPRSAFFMGELQFVKKRWFHRLLHAGSGEEIRRRLQKKGRPVTVLPVVLSA